MTFLEKLKEDNPSRNDVWYRTQVNEYCPHEYGYGESKLKNCGYSENCDPELCFEHWNREMPNTKSQAYKQNLREKIIEEIKHAEKRSNNAMCIGKDITTYLLEVLEEHTDYNDGYNKGLNDVWEFLKKWDEMTGSQAREVFGVFSLCDLLEFTPQEALAKSKAYEEAQKIEVGDVVKIEDCKALVIDILDETYCSVLTEVGCCQSKIMRECKKTGKHIDIQSILEQIGE